MMQKCVSLQEPSKWLHNRQPFKYIIQENLFKSILDLNRVSVFQDDTEPKHTAKTVKKHNKLRLEIVV